MFHVKHPRGLELVVTFLNNRCGMFDRTNELLGLPDLSIYPPHQATKQSRGKALPWRLIEQI